MSAREALALAIPPGSVVRRDGVDMTVHGLRGGSVLCKWFEGTSLREDAFRSEELELVARPRGVWGLAPVGPSPHPGARG